MSIVSHQQNAAWDAHYDENFPRPAALPPLVAGQRVFVQLAGAFRPYEVLTVEAKYFTAAITDEGFADVEKGFADVDEANDDVLAAVLADATIDLWLSDEGKTWKREVA